MGRRPHYYEAGERLVEAYLLDFDRDLYGATIRVELGSLVRGQRSFETEDELVDRSRAISRLSVPERPRPRCRPGCRAPHLSDFVHGRR